MGFMHTFYMGIPAHRYNFSSNRRILRKSLFNHVVLRVYKPKDERKTMHQNTSSLPSQTLTSQPNTSIGVDMFEIERMRCALEKHPHMERKLFTPEEIAYAHQGIRPYEHFAAFFSAREAVLKALGVGFSAGVGFKDVSVKHDHLGRPYPYLQNKAKELAEDLGIKEIALSLSHTHTTAVANALAIREDAIPQTIKTKDLDERLRISFRDARAIVMELDKQTQNELSHTTSNVVASMQTHTSAAQQDQPQEVQTKQIERPIQK